MAIVLNRLDRLQKKTASMNGAAFSLDSQSHNMTVDGDSLSKQAMFTMLVQEDSSLILEYTTLRALLHQTLSASPVMEADATRLVKEALVLADRLDEKYTKYINELPAFKKTDLEEHKKTYRRWLAMNMDLSALTFKYNTLQVLIQQAEAEGIDNETEFRSMLQEAVDLGTVLKKRLSCPHDNQQARYQQWLTEHALPKHEDMPGAAFVRIWTENSNPYRLGVLRMRRFLIALIPIVNDFDRYGSWILWSDVFVSPCLSYFSLVFFMPRLILNLYTLCSHWVEHAFMSAEEASLGATVRFHAQWDRLWQNITNDVAWTLNGILMCCVFIDTWRFMAVYFTPIIQLYDLTMISIKVYTELNRFDALEQHYKQMQWFEPSNHLLSNYLKQLHNRIECEKNVLYLSWANFFVLFVAACAALPSAAALSAMIPVAGAMASVLMTFINFWGRAYLRPPAVMGLNELFNAGLPQLSAENESPSQASTNDEVTVLRRVHSSNDVLAGSLPALSIDPQLKKSRSSSDLLYSPNGISLSFSQSTFFSRERTPELPPKLKRTASHRSDDFFIGEIDQRKVSF